MQTRTLLLLSASVGSGHTSAAAQLHSELSQALHNIDVEHINICNFAPKWQRFLLEKVWLLFSTWPILRFLYSFAHKRIVSSDSCALKLCPFFRTITTNLMKSFSEHKIVAIIALHPGAACVAHLWKLERDVYICAAATDMVVHSFHVLPGFDRVFGDNRGVFSSVRARHMKSSDRFVASGLPVYCGSRNVVDRFVPHSDLHRDFVFLITFGGSGTRLLAHIGNILRLAYAMPDAQIFVVCGRSRISRLLFLLWVSALGLTNKFFVFGFVNDMRALTRHADIVIGKAGGITIAETIACSRPFIAIDFLPGQEEYNVDFLVKEGLGHAALTFPKLLSAIRAEKETLNLGKANSNFEKLASRGVVAVAEIIALDLAMFSLSVKQLERQRSVVKVKELTLL